MPEYPEITVIIPAHNAGAHLEACLDSVLGQSFTDWELIICDDGSTDDTGKISDRYSESDSRIKVIHKANAGVSAARNSCLDLAEGRYIAFVDADDTLDKDYLDELLNSAEKHGADITQCSFCFVNEKGERSADPYASDSVYTSGDEIMEAYFSGPVGDIRVSVWAKLFRRDLFDGIRFDTGLRIFEDAYYVYECCRKAGSVCIFSAPLYFYRQHKGSTMGSRMHEIYPDYFTVFARQKRDNLNKKTIYGNILRREAENALWLMRIMAASGRKRELWDIRNRVLDSAGTGIFSSVPVGVRSKLLGMTIVPHIYFAMLKKRIKEENE